MISAIKFVSVPVHDQDRALAFYTTRLGFTVATDQPFGEKQRWIELRVPKAETRVVLFTAEGEEKRIGTMMNMSFMLAGTVSANPWMFALTVFIILGWTGWQVLGVLQGMNLISLPWVPVQFTQSVIPIGAILFIICEALSLPEYLAMVRSGVSHDEKAVMEQVQKVED